MIHSYIREWHYWGRWEGICFFGRLISGGLLIFPPFQVLPWWVWLAFTAVFHLLIRQVYARLARIRPYAVRQYLQQQQFRRWGVIQ